jgi:hypothetical protein
MPYNLIFGMNSKIVTISSLKLQLNSSLDQQIILIGECLIIILKRVPEGSRHKYMETSCTCLHSKVISSF